MPIGGLGRPGPLARVLRCNVMAIEARRIADGTLAWSTEQGALRDQGWWITSSPAVGVDRAFVCMAKDERSAVAALDLADGHPLWVTNIANHRAAMPMLGHDFHLDAYLAPPLVRGRRVYLALDQGSMLALDAGDGEVAWAARYPRAQVRVEDVGPTAELGMRSPTRVLAAGEDRLLIAPRDALGVYGITTDGALAWSFPALPARHLSCISPDGLTAIADWLFVQAIDTRTGALRWRFKPWPSDGQLQGHALIAGGGGARRHRARALPPVARQRCIDFAPELGRARGERPLQFLPRTAGPVRPRQWPAGGLRRPQAGQGAVQRGRRGARRRHPVLRARGGPRLAHHGGRLVDWRRHRTLDRPARRCPARMLLLVRFARSLAYLDIAKRRIIWRIRLAVDTRSAYYLDHEIVSVQRNGAVAYDRETGAMQWQTQFSENVLDALHFESPEKYVAVGPTLLLVINRNSVWVYSSQDGHRIGGYDWDGGPMCVTEYDGKVWMCGRRGNNITVDVREPSALGAMFASDQILGLSDRDGAMVDGASIVAHTHTDAVRYDFATRTTHKYPLVGDAYRFERSTDSPGFQVAYVHDLADHWTSAVLDKDDKVVFSEHTQDGGWPMENRLIWNYQLHGNRLYPASI